jgi:diguanylate cyclase (GGDEF)-like protein
MDEDVTANILLVDDRPENLVVLEEILRPLGHNLVKASSGDEALRQLLRYDFAVILLDVQMPGLDGFETAAHIKQREKSRHIPIIFLTAINREPHQAMRGYSAGAVDYLAKPFDPWVLSSKVAVFVDLFRERKRAHAAELALLHQAFHDGLTGLPNRALLLDRLSHALARGERRPTHTAVLFLDIDRFKGVNDSLGHAVGDHLIVAVADRLRSVVRPGDTVARFGGDEFVILCEELDHEREAVAIAERMAHSLVVPFHLGDRRIVLTASIGVAFASSSSRETADSLLRGADCAMYRAKERGRHRIELFDDDMRARALARLETENDLRTAIDEGQLRVYYQPVVELPDTRVIGVEALVRWEHPHRGLVLPSDFIPLAEESGLILPIGALVLREACGQVAMWNGAHRRRAALSASVNLSAHQLVFPGLAEVVAQALADSALDPKLLCLEITETVLMEEAASSRAALDSLKELGVQLAVDDFGTGYSSLLYLRRFPVDVLKVDRSFVSGLGQSPADTAIVAGVVGLAHALGLVPVAEGVETPEQAARLVELGCSLAQGYLWSRPLPVERLWQWLDDVGTEGRRTEPPGLLVVDDEPGLRKAVELAR